MTEEIRSGNEVTISAEEFKLVKSFFPSFTRATGIKTNDYVIDWNSLMPLVEKIESTIGTRITIKGVECEISIVDYYDLQIERLKIQSVYKAVLEFIEWYNNQKAKS